MSAMTIDQICQWLAAAAPGARLSADSRQIGPGDVFFAYPGAAADGRAFIAAARARGAAAVLYDPAGFDWHPDWALPRLAVPQLKALAGPIGHALCGRPDAAMFSVGVTGTNGKTSCAVWLGQALAQLGQRTVVIGTLGVGLFGPQCPGRFEETGNTTPDALLLARKLAEARAAGAEALAIEVSSIGLEQGRADGMHFDVALFTNLTRDHLDYHGDMARYAAAKARLFDWPGLKAAVVNLDDPMGQRLLARVAARPGPPCAAIGYTLADAAARPAPAGVALLRASHLRSRHAGTDFHLDSPFGAAQVKTRLVGHFNISNALAVLGALLAKGVALRAALDAVEALAPAPGRMQQLGGQDAPMVVIDYAHTPDALEQTLAALRRVAEERGGQLWCVFGCGGERDPGKRPQMGAIAQAADHVLVTSDNPRHEDPHAIIAQIVAGMERAHPSSSLQTVEDRAAAILAAVRQAAKADVILLAGKGHEPYQDIKGKKLPFSDADHAALALAARATMKRPH